MKDYLILVFWSDEDQAYIADIPDLKTCSAWGATPEEAVRQLEIAKQAWLAVARLYGDPVPEPRLTPALCQGREV
jgi:predicted RNase H-like HicB family nuclease